MSEPVNTKAQALPDQARKPRTDPRSSEAAASPGVDPRRDRDIQSPVQGNREVSWTPPATLPDPDASAHPGYVHRWVRIDTYGTPDPKNYSARMREGWEPCRAEDYPEITSNLMPNSPRSNVVSGRNPDQSVSGNIVIGGLMLSRMPVETAEARKRYYANLAERQLEAVNQSYLREEHPSMPLVREARSRTAFGKGSAKDD